MTTGAQAATGGLMAARVIGFVQHLRLNDFAVGPAESSDALTLLRETDLSDRAAVHHRLKTLLTGCPDEWERFDDLFEAYWLARGKVRARLRPRSDYGSVQVRRRDLWRDRLEGGGPEQTRADRAMTPATDELASDDGTGRLIASRQQALKRTDLRHIADPAEMAEAERLAYRLAHAMRYRLSRRYRAVSAGERIDLRRTIRRNLSKGGEPIDLVRKGRPDRPIRVVVLLDVSGSMDRYSRFFLQFVKGLVCQWLEADAYLFHTRLIRVTDAIRERDSLKAMARLSLMAEGFGGGTELGRCLASFNDRYAKRALNSRSVVLILSDGYDTGAPEVLARELARLKRRARRLVWLNPMLGWQDYEPVTKAMAAAMPLIDHFAAAHTLEALAAIEPDLARL